MDSLDCYTFLKNRYKALNDLDEVLYTLLGEANPEISLILIVVTEWRFHNLYEDAFRRDVLRLDLMWSFRRPFPISYIFGDKLKVIFTSAEYERLIGYDPKHTAFLFYFP